MSRRISTARMPRPRHRSANSSSRVRSSIGLMILNMLEARFARAPPIRLRDGVPLRPAAHPLERGARQSETQLVRRAENAADRRGRQLSDAIRKARVKGYALGRQVESEHLKEVIFGSRKHVVQPRRRVFEQFGE